MTTYPEARAKLPRVFFDGNDGEPVGGYYLDFPTSEADLELIPEKHEGMRVIIYSPNELEFEAILRWDAKYDRWLGVPVGEPVYLDGSNG